MPDAFQMVGISVVESLAQIQEYLWTVQNQRIDALRLLTNVITLIRSDVDDPDSVRVLSRAHSGSSRIRARSSSSRSTRPRRRSRWRPRALIKGDLQNMHGRPAVRGRAPSRASIDQQTATGMSIVTSIAQKMIQARKQHYMWAYSKIGELFLGMMGQMLREERTIPQIGARGRTSFSIVHPLDLQGEFDVNVNVMDESAVRQEKHPRRWRSSTRRSSAARSCRLDMTPSWSACSSSGDQDTEPFLPGSPGSPGARRGARRAGHRALAVRRARMRCSRGHPRRRRAGGRRTPRLAAAMGGGAGGLAVSPDRSRTNEFRPPNGWDRHRCVIALASREAQAELNRRADRISSLLATLGWQEMEAETDRKIAKLRKVASALALAPAGADQRKLDTFGAPSRRSTGSWVSPRTPRPPWRGSSRSRASRSRRRSPLSTNENDDIGTAMSEREFAQELEGKIPALFGLDEPRSPRSEAATRAEEEPPEHVEDIPPSERPEPVAPEVPPVEEPAGCGGRGGRGRRRRGDVDWAKRKYGADVTLEKVARVAFEQEQLVSRLGSKAKENEGLAAEWYQYAQSLEAQLQRAPTGMPMSSAEEQWVEKLDLEPGAGRDPGEDVRQRSVVPRGDQPDRAGGPRRRRSGRLLCRDGRAEQAARPARAVPQNGETRESLVGASVARLGIDLARYGQPMMQKIGELASTTRTCRPSSPEPTRSATSDFRPSTTSSARGTTRGVSFATPNARRR